ncbi:MAG: thioesterase [Flavobacteriaceae bacterium]|nr:thioesterase [Flavobacteriaceae bacterium]|tara:strand:- start:18559 stop:18981 length:423 start_codon:yes stop_codon:yes gene_type:complete
MLFKLPAAWLTGVRVIEATSERCVVNIRHRWINQNPFNSIFWAVQGMAAEMTTGFFITREINKSGRNISMLVAKNKAIFTKKATGKINFICNQGLEVKKIIDKAITTGNGQTLWIDSKGYNENDVMVSHFSFEWSVKLRK